MPTIVNGGNMPRQEDAATQANQTDNQQVHETTTAADININQIVNQQVPIVVFVGPPASGKSMILVRLAKYLRTQGYTIKTDPTFLNTSQYVKDCKEFNTKLDTCIALEGTVKYLLVDVFNNDGKHVAKLLEAPGEDFYDTDPTTAQVNNNRILPYLTAIMTSRNPKSYVVLLDLDTNMRHDTTFRQNLFHRDAYTSRFLNYFYSNIRTKRDRIILLYNKIDCTRFGTHNGPINEKDAKADAAMHYPTLFAKMKVKKLGGFMTVDNFVFKTFCTGTFSDSTDNYGNSIQIYNLSDDVYPQALWTEIIKKW